MSSPAQLVSMMEKRMPLEVSAAFQRLIQAKHLYQSETVDMSWIESELSKVDAQTAAAVRIPIYAQRDGRWLACDPRRPDVPPVGPIGDRNYTYLMFNIPTVKLFCETCDRIEPFNPLAVDDVTDRSGYEVSPPQTIQVFVVSFLCQSCKGMPEFFMVRRLNLKLNLTGRAPMEHLTVPSFIPRNQRGFFSGAILAFQAGQTLPALFMLRTTIEQFVRERYNKPVDTPDGLASAFDSYMASLPDEFRSTFPSLPDLYGKLSVALHSADASVDLFSVSLSAIERHFDARRLFELG